MLNKYTNKTILIFLIIIVVSYNLIWDALFYTIGITSVQQSLVRGYSLAIGGLVFILFYMLLCKYFANNTRTNITTTEEYALFIIFLSISFYGLIIGIINGNNIYYLIGDTYKLFILPVTYTIIRFTLNEKEAALLFKILILTVFISLSLDVAQRLPHMVNGYTRKEDPFWISNLLAFSFILAQLKYGWFNKKKYLLYTLLIIIVMISSVVSFHRSIFIIMLGIILFSLGRDVKYFKNLLFIIMTLSTIIIVVIINPFFDSTIVTNNIAFAAKTMESRFKTLLEFKRSSSASVKIEENKTIIRDLNSDKIYWVFGRGSGAEYYPESEILYNAPGYKRYRNQKKIEKIHNIHNQYTAMLFRYGMVGLALFIIILIILFRVVRTTIGQQDTNSIYRYSIYLYFLCTGLLMLGFSVFLGDINWGILLGISTKLNPKTTLKGI